jgi:hypothetical protein
MTLAGNRLVVHMSRLMYDINGVHHQGDLTFEVDTGTMTATTFQQLGDNPYSSHSFQQLVAMNGSSLVTIDHGDAYPRAIRMGVMANYPSARKISNYAFFDFNGNTGDNFTGAAVTDLISGPQRASRAGQLDHAAKCSQRASGESRRTPQRLRYQRLH